MNRKVVFFVLVAVCFWIGFCYADSQYSYHIVNVIPEPASGAVSISSIGKNSQPGNQYLAPVDVDVHEVVLTAGTITPSNIAPSGMNLVEYKVTDPALAELSHAFSHSFTVDVVIMPGYGRNAFVMIKERNVDNAYKVTLDAANRKIKVEQIKNGVLYMSYERPYPVKLYTVYQVKLNFGYESSGGSAGNRVTIREKIISGLGTRETWNTVLDNKFYTLGLEQLTSWSVNRFFVGSVYSNAKFTNEQFYLIER